MKHLVKVVVLCILFMFAASNVLAAAGFQDKVNIFGSVTLDEPVKGSVVAIFGNVNAGYRVDGDVVAVFGNVNIQSGVSGDVVSIFGGITLGSEASVSGDVVSIGPGGIKRAPGSRVAGDSVGINLGSISLPNFKMHVPPLVNNRFVPLNFLGNVGFVIISLLALLAISISSERIRKMSECVEDNIVRKTIIGLVIFLGFPILTILLALTIIGLPIAVIFFGVAFILGFAAFGAYIGRKILELLNSSSNVYGEFIIGAIVLAIIISTIHFTWWIGAALVVMCLGLSFDTGFGKKANKV